MPVGGGGADDWRDQLIRRVRVVRGCLTFRVRCHPAFDYARATHETVIDPANGADFHSPGLSLGLATEVPLRPDGRGVSRRVHAARGGEARPSCSVRSRRGAEPAAPPRRARRRSCSRRRCDFWRRWLSASAPTTAAGARWSTARRWCSSCSPSSRPARSSRRRRAACPSISAACATGTTATPGSATRRSPLRAAAHRLHRGGRARSWAGSRRAARRPRATRALQIVYGIDGRQRSDRG